MAALGKAISAAAPRALSWANGVTAQNQAGLRALFRPPAAGALAGGGTRAAAAGAGALEGTGAAAAAWGWGGSVAGIGNAMFSTTWLSGQLGLFTGAELPTNVQVHHAIPWNNRTFNHQAHELVQHAGVDLATHARNMRPLVNHLSSHSPAYHWAVQNRLDAAWAGVKGKGMVEARRALNQVIDTIWDDIHSGALKPYGQRTVYLP
jgi:hypothetical protein